nr:pentatricopeptide repeat-containing protein At4g21065-like [Tanacetum cinerariifolium]
MMNGIGNSLDFIGYCCDDAVEFVRWMMWLLLLLMLDYKGLDGVVFISVTKLRCEETVYACKVFDEMYDKGLVVWSYVIDGYVKVGLFDEGLGVFGEMLKARVIPDEVVMASVVKGIAGWRLSICMRNAGVLRKRKRFFMEWWLRIRELGVP